ncbi:MAG: sterol desaturase family protein [Proteobacteria bacterium]|nr:sterol desaturase family protein [Pseudomonadota bacterium]MBU1717389.1 sterol desaturase family protein [Pseudomonadota bacterium]
MELEKLRLVLYWSGLALFLLLELFFTYRQPSVSKLKRWLTNLPLSIVNGVVYHWLYFGSILAILTRNDGGKYGLLNQYPLPDWLQIVLGILLLDFVIYIWHLLNHEVPFFWRFHRVHHSDINMDVSTANRFHLGEILMSGLVRLVVIYAFGISLLSYILFEIMVNIAIQFHHSSIRLPAAFENIWMFLLVPPSMHRIHHSVKIKERDSNYGVIFSLWDRFLGTMTRKIDQDKIVIGLGSHRDFTKLGFGRVMLMPFTRRSL